MEEVAEEGTRELHINVKGRQSRALPDLLRQVIEAAQDGWIPKDDFNTISSCRMYSQNWFHVVLVRAEKSGNEDVGLDVVVVDYTADEERLAEDLKESEELNKTDFLGLEEDSNEPETQLESPLTESNSPSVSDRVNIMLDRVEAAQTKAELVLLGKTFDIDIPKEKKNFQQIKKFMRGVIGEIKVK